MNNLKCPLYDDMYMLCDYCEHSYCVHTADKRKNRSTRFFDSLSKRTRNAVRRNDIDCVYLLEALINGNCALNLRNVGKKSLQELADACSEEFGRRVCWKISADYYIPKKYLYFEDEWRKEHEIG